MKKGVVLIENRKELIKPTLAKHIRFIPNDWSLKVYDELKINSVHDYNLILTNPDFWNALPFEKVLIIQHDSELLREGIEDFIKYDYVGSPWKFQEHGGNGGLSIRSRSAMIEISESSLYRNANVDGQEDVYFSNRMINSKWNLAPRQICSDFACETIFQLGTVGAHAIDKYLTKEQCNQIRNQYK